MTLIQDPGRTYPPPPPANVGVILVIQIFEDYEEWCDWDDPDVVEGYYDPLRPDVEAGFVFPPD